MKKWLRKLRHITKQRRYTQEHRASETKGIRLLRLDDQPARTYMGRRAWCDTILRTGCPALLHEECCDCTHRGKL